MIVEVSPFMDVSHGLCIPSVFVRDPAREERYTIDGSEGFDHYHRAVEADWFPAGGVR